MKASIDRSGCIGCGLCAEACSEVFRMAEDGLAEVCADISPDAQASSQEAAQSCPVQVITLED